jgi:[1-hydroxy-2-(trimethylamino)ethyl]phosphonate dioxygenase
LTVNVVEHIEHLFAVAGSGAYFGEAVSQTEHALQTARLAELAGAADALIVAALLHDIGHLLHGQGEDIAERGNDARHEVGGAAWLEWFFGPAVADPVRLHVAAKRYLCAVRPGYQTALSPASRRSLELQGGVLSADEVKRFEAEQASADAVALRLWDDEAKVPGLAVPGLEHYRSRLAALAVRGQA